MLLIVFPLVVAFVALAAAIEWWGAIRDRYDRSRWRFDPEYPRYGATHAEVFRWWIRAI